jgi:hypothetical protein
MTGEINICGVLFPPLLVWLAFAFAAAAAMRALFARAGLYRFVWHRPLFDLCLLIILTGAVSLCAAYF